MLLSENNQRRRGMMKWSYSYHPEVDSFPIYFPIGVRPLRVLFLLFHSKLPTLTNFYLRHTFNSFIVTFNVWDCPQKLISVLT